VHLGFIILQNRCDTESGNISNLCQEVMEISPDHDLLVVDDNSVDGTGKIVEELKQIIIMHLSF